MIIFTIESVQDINFFLLSFIFKNSNIRFAVPSAILLNDNIFINEVLDILVLSNIAFVSKI